MSFNVQNPTGHKFDANERAKAEVTKGTLDGESQ